MYHKYALIGNIIHSKSFKFKARKNRGTPTGNNRKNGEIAVALKNLSNFWKKVES